MVPQKSGRDSSPVVCKKKVGKKTTGFTLIVSPPPFRRGNPGTGSGAIGRTTISSGK